MKKLLLLTGIFFWITMVFSQNEKIYQDEFNLKENNKTSDVRSVSLEPDDGNHFITPPSYSQAAFDGNRSGFGYAWNIFTNGATVPTGPVRVSLSNGALISLKDVPISEIWMSGADMVEDEWYAVSGGTTNSGLYTVNTATGEYDLVGYTGFAFNGLAYDSYSGVLYASMNLSTFSRLYAINVNTAQANLVGFLGLFSMFGIAADHSGTIYGINSNSDLISINPQNGQSTVIGPLGITINFAQDIAYDRDNDILYGTLYADGVGGLYTIDVETGTATLIHNFLAEIAGFAVPYSLADDNAPAALQNATLTPGEMGALEATVSWDNPVLTYDGSALTQIDSVVILRNQQFLASVHDVTPGQSDSFTDTTITSSGVYSYRIFAVNATGPGVKTSIFAFIGEDVPSAPQNLTLVPQGDDALLSWDAPTTGLGGGYISSDNITYTIVRFPQQTTVATDISETQFVDTTLPGMGNYYYQVTAKNLQGTGGFATTDIKLMAGGEYLMFEPFNYQAGQSPPGWQRTGVEHTWRVFIGNDAGGETPQLGLNWNPLLDGMSRYMSYNVDLQGHTSLRYRFKQFFLNKNSDEGELIAADITFDGGETWINLWDTLIGLQNIPASTREFIIDVPDGATSMNVGYRFEGNTININWWSLDDITIQPFFPNDLKAVSVSGNTTPGINSENIYSVVIENFGSAPQSNYTVKLLKGEGEEIGSLVGVAIEPGELLTFEFPWTPGLDDEGQNALYAEVVFEDDQNPFNNQTPQYNVWVQAEQVVVIPIGDGTELQGLPFAFQWHHSLSQTLYFPEEIGMQAGGISAVKYFNDFDISLPNRTIKIFLGETQATDLNGGWVDPASLQLVFDGTVDFPAGQNEIYIHFDSIYDYQGGNLVVYTYKQDLEWSPIRNFYSTAAPNSARSRRAARFTTPYNPLQPDQPGAVMHFFPNTVFYIDGSGTGVLEGTVTTDGVMLDNVDVKLAGTQLTTKTNDDGYFILPHVLPDTYSVEFSKFGFYTVIEDDVDIVVDEATTVNVDMVPLPLVTVTGLITGSDFPEIGLDSVRVELSGYNYHEVFTNENGNFTIEEVFGDKTYNITIFHERFILYENTVTVATVDLDLGTIILQENPLPVRNVLAVETEEGALISWEEPQLYPVREFRYDDGEDHGMLGFSTGNLNSVMGSVHRHVAELYEMKWQLVNPDVEHATVRVWVLGLTPEGLPDRTQVIYNASNVPNTPFEWTTHVFPDTLHAPNGFFVGLSAQGHLGLAMDDGQGPLWPFVEGTHFGIGNITNANTPFTPVENWNFPFNFLIRAAGRDFGQINFDNKSLALQTDEAFVPDFTLLDVSAGTTAGKNELPETRDKAGAGSKVLETFSVYRLLSEDLFEEENWVEVASQISGWEFVDTDWPELEEGAYLFAVVAHYTNDVSSPPAFSNMLPKDMFVAYTVNVTTNSGDNPEGALLTLVNQSGNPDHVYTTAATADGEAIFNGVWRGLYTLTIELPGFESFMISDLDVDDHGLSFDAELIEIITTPYGLIVETENQQPGDARLTWRVNYELFEGFEGDFPPHGWKTMNPDGGTGWIQLGANTTPLPGWTGGVAFPAPGGGNYMAYVTYIHGGETQNDQWLVTPELIAVDDFEFSFYIRKHPLHFQDNVDIRISTTVNNDPAAFDVLVDALTFPTGTPDAWVKYTYNVADFVEPGTAFFVAFREHVENNQTQGSGIMVDNVSYGPESRFFALNDEPFPAATEPVERDLSGVYHHTPAPKSLKAFLGYNIFLNDMDNPFAEGIMQEEYLFENLPEGNHQAGVQSVFTTGSSEVISIDFTIVIPPPTFTATFDVKDQDGAPVADAVITFDTVVFAPGVYVFEDLLAGTYLYSVAREGYTSASGSVTIVDQDVAVDVVLNEIIPETYSVSFVVKDDQDQDILDAVITFDGNANAPGVYVFDDLLAGTWPFSVAREGFVSVAGDVVVVDADVVETVIMLPVYTPELFTLTLNVDMTNAQGFDPQIHEVFVSGTFGEGMNWNVPGSSPALKLTRVEQTLTFAIALELESGNFLYKYASDAFGQGWNGAEWEGDPNRSVELHENTTVLDIWGVHPDQVSANGAQMYSLNIYPNPVGAKLNIQSGIILKNILLVDITGRVVFESEANDKTYQIDVSGFENGVYFLRIMTSEGTQIRKIQVVK